MFISINASILIYSFFNHFNTNLCTFWTFTLLYDPKIESNYETVLALRSIWTKVQCSLLSLYGIMTVSKSDIFIYFVQLETFSFKNNLVIKNVFNASTFDCEYSCRSFLKYVYNLRWELIITSLSHIPFFKHYRSSCVKLIFNLLFYYKSFVLIISL